MTHSSNSTFDGLGNLDHTRFAVRYEMVTGTGANFL